MNLVGRALGFSATPTIEGLSPRLAPDAVAGTIAGRLRCTLPGGRWVLDANTWLDVDAATGQLTRRTGNFEIGSYTIGGSYVVNLLALRFTIEFDLTLRIAVPAPTPAPTPTPTPVATIAVSNLSAAEGDPATATVTATRNGLAGALSGTWAVDAGTGPNPANPADFGGTFPSGTWTIPAGTNSVAITVTSSEDALVEPNDTYRLAVSYNGVTSYSDGTIVNDDAATIAVSNLSAGEGDPATATVTATRNGVTGTLSGTWAVSAATGLNPADAADFGGTFPSGTWTIPAGADTATITVTSSEDTTVEPNEAYRLGVTFNGVTVYSDGTIVNDDDAPTEPSVTPIYNPNLTKGTAGQTVPLVGNDGWKRQNSNLADNAAGNLGVNEFGKVVQVANNNDGEANKVAIMHEFATGDGYTVAFNVSRPTAGHRGTLLTASTTTNGYNYRGIAFTTKADGGWMLALPDVEALEDTSAEGNLLPDGEDVHIYHNVAAKQVEVIISGGKSFGPYDVSQLPPIGQPPAGNVGFAAGGVAGLQPVGSILGYPPKVWPGRHLGGSGQGNPSDAVFSTMPSIGRQGGGTTYNVGDTIVLNSGVVDPATGTLVDSELRRGANVIAVRPLPATYVLQPADAGRALRIVSIAQNAAGKLKQASSNTALIAGSGTPVPQRLLGEGPQGKTYFSSSRTDENLLEPSTWEARIANVPASEADVALTDANYAFSAAGFPTTMALRDGRPLLNIVRRALNVTKKGTPLALTWSGDIDCNLNLPDGGTSNRSGNRFDYNHPSDPGAEGYAAFVITAIRSPLTALDLREKVKADSPDAAIRTRKFNPKFIAEQSKFAIMRGMDLLNTNSNWREVTWDTRPTNPWKTRGHGAMTWEDLVALANLTKCDLYINVPWWSWASNNAYCRQLFAYLRDNLDPRLKLYIEVQNEVWNTTFGVHLAIARWFRYGDPDSKGQNTVDSEVIAATEFSKVTFGDVIEGYAKRYDEIMIVAAEVFAGQMSRVVRVFGTTPIVQGDADRPKQFIRGALTARPAIKDRIDLVVTGTYFGYSVNPLAAVNPSTGQIVPGTGVEHPDWTADMTVLKTRTIDSVNAVIEEILQFQAWLLATYDLKMGSYEGGQSHWDPIYNPSTMWRLSTENPPGQGEIVRPLYYAYHKNLLFVDVMELFWSRWINEVQAPICGFVDKGMMNKGNDGPFGMGWNDDDSLDPASPDFAPKRAGREKVLALNPRQEVA